MTQRDLLYQNLTACLGFQPTEGQQTALHHLAAFLLSEKKNPAYLLQGYAGTGKTSLVTTLVKALPSIGMKYVLMAPTGRAAKVLSNYTRQPAYTIHRKIYRFQPLADGSLRMTRAENKHKNTVFIIDECSMIYDTLDDLMGYVFSGESCRMLLIGDKAQLPPVGLDISPANDIFMLKNSYSLTAASFELTEVVRQSLDSGILFNATQLRQKMSGNDFRPPFFSISIFNDIKQADPQSFEELLFDSFGDGRKDDAIVICRSNKRANLFNQAIRSTIQQKDGEISAGDRLMVVKNNYFWTDDEQKIGFIANGDLVEVMRINKFEEMYGFHFADIDIRLLDYPDEPNLSVKIILETLGSESPALTADDAERLYKAVEEDYNDIPNNHDRRKAIKSNPWHNALQVKFGYALTCHKTQGGQWTTVFIEAPYKPEDESFELADLRWLYTALTRATDKVYLINFKEEYFERGLHKGD